MHNGEAVSFFDELHRLHKTPTALGPIPRVDIHVFAPQALWTVVGVATTHNCAAAVLTHKIFFGLFKLFTH